MDEAPLAVPKDGQKKSAARKKRRLRNQKGQAFIEYLLVLFLAIAFLRFVFFNREYGFKASLDRTMLRLGSHLEANLKTGTRPGKQGSKSLEPYAGTSAWSN